jgi:hypothetical protein
VLGGDPPPEVPARVSLGRSGRSRGIGLAVLAALVALVAGAVLLGGDDGDDAASDPSSTSTTRGRPTTTAVPVTAPHGQVLPVLTGAALLLATPPGSWIHLDLDTGARTEAPLGEQAYGSVVGVRGGIALTVGEAARYVPMPGGEPVDLGEAGQVLATDRADEVWLVAGPSFGFDEPADPERPDRAWVVGLDGEVRSRPFDIPNGFVAGSTARGLVVVAGGRAYLVDRDGDASLLATGDVLGTSRHHVVLSSCEDLDACRVVLLDVRTGVTRPVDGMDGSTRFGGNVTVSPEGDAFAVVRYGPSSPTLAIGATEGGRLLSFDSPLSGPGPVWLPAGQGLLVVSPAGDANVHRLQVVDGRLQRHPIPALADDYGEYLVLIPE